MSLNGDSLRGHTDMMLLSIISDKDSYGYEINKKIEDMTNSDFVFTEATLYTSFKRLVKLDYLKTYWLESTSNKKRKYYSITNKGKSMLEKQIHEWNSTKELIDQIIRK
ncbi:lineage-specific thermal regulator protein [Candidatus Izimaplasma bacterium HR1]|jgi:DNA-binding PadR family transcriptional regulator|uniref:PadR family transcriptional regulator n=1 Tax=Candidatus Izimoplasma sp. HR1 TaxID=1541959 RepID=UPI0004F903D0|nr:lineage-specific thermal regulator protein [Candidatus Izimaplasma bacterium HR1]